MVVLVLYLSPLEMVFDSSAASIYIQLSDYDFVSDTFQKNVVFSSILPKNVSFV